MIPGTTRERARQSGIPRESGDDPRDKMHLFITPEYSPRERG